METLSPQIELSGFFRSVAGAAQRVLLLDYDGTIAPFQADRTQARPYPEVAAILQDMLAAGTTRVVLVSGRAVVDLLPLLDGLTPLPEIWGSHGVERRMPDGRLEAAGLAADVAAGLEHARQWACDEGLEERCDLKPASIALHWRGLCDTEIQELADRARHAWEPLCEATADLHIKPFDGGLELRTAGMDKGRAVRTLLQEAGGEAVMAYLGDDETDEDAFEAMKGDRSVANAAREPITRLSVLVRSVFRPTAADLWLEPPHELVAFLKDWVQAVEQGGGC